MDLNNCTILASASGDLNNLYLGIKEFSAKRIIILIDDENLAMAETVRQRLGMARIPVHIIQYPMKDPAGGIFGKIKKIKDSYENENLIINAASGNNIINSMLISAAFVNGLKAFTVNGSDIVHLPVLNYSYYRLMTARKVEILQILEQYDGCESLDELSQKTNMSLPLASYHVNGNLKSGGLLGLGLIEKREMKGKISVSLSTLGKLLVQGYSQTDFG